MIPKTLYITAILYLWLVLISCIAATKTGAISDEKEGLGKSRTSPETIPDNPNSTNDPLLEDNVETEQTTFLPDAATRSSSLNETENNDNIEKIQNSQNIVTDINDNEKPKDDSEDIEDVTLGENKNIVSEENTDIPSVNIIEKDSSGTLLNNPDKDISPTRFFGDDNESNITFQEGAVITPNPDNEPVGENSGNEPVNENLPNIVQNKFSKRILYSPTAEDEVNPINSDDIPESPLDAWRPVWPFSKSTSSSPNPTAEYRSVQSTTVIESSLQPNVDASEESVSVSKEPVTAYYFDLSSISPTVQVGPLFDPSQVLKVSISHPTATVGETDESRVTKLHSSVDRIHVPDQKEDININPTPTLRIHSEVSKSEGRKPFLHANRDDSLLESNDYDVNISKGEPSSEFSSFHNKTNLHNSRPEYILGTSTDFNFKHDELTHVKNTSKTDLLDPVVMPSILSPDQSMEPHPTTGDISADKSNSLSASLFTPPINPSEIPLPISFPNRVTTRIDIDYSSRLSRIPLWKRLSEKSSATNLNSQTRAVISSSKVHSSIQDSTRSPSMAFENDIPIGILSPGILKPSVHPKNDVDYENDARNKFTKLSTLETIPDVESSIQSSTLLSSINYPTPNDHYSTHVFKSSTPEVLHKSTEQLKHSLNTPSDTVNNAFSIMHFIDPSITSTFLSRMNETDDAFESATTDSAILTLSSKPGHDETSDIGNKLAIFTKSLHDRENDITDNPIVNNFTPFTKPSHVISYAPKTHTVKYMNKPTLNKTVLASIMSSNNEKMSEDSTTNSPEKSSLDIHNKSESDVAETNSITGLSKNLLVTSSVFNNFQNLSVGNILDNSSVKFTDEEIPIDSSVKILKQEDAVEPQEKNETSTIPYKTDSEHKEEDLNITNIYDEKGSGKIANKTDPFHHVQDPFQFIPDPFQFVPNYKISYIPNSTIPTIMSSTEESLFKSKATTSSYRDNDVNYITDGNTTKSPINIASSIMFSTLSSISAFFSTSSTTTSTTESPQTSSLTTPENIPDNYHFVSHSTKNRTLWANETTTQEGIDSGVMDHTEKNVVVFVTNTPGAEPELNLLETHENGTISTRPTPYLKAAVSYDVLEFCNHHKKIEALLGQWIRSHLSNASNDSFEVEIFHQPDCENLYIHSDAANNLENKTTLYFYVKKNGEISPNSTLHYPRNPTNLEISQELEYLKEKILHLELMNASSSEDLLIEEAAVGTSIVVIVVVTTLLILLLIGAILAFFILKRRRAAESMHGRRCTPAPNDAYSLDSVSVFYHSLRRKSRKRASNKSLKSYLNQGFDDPNLPSRPLNFAKLTHFISDNEAIYEEFTNIPSVVPKYDEMPKGVEEKNRYANVIPVPETRILLETNRNSPSSQYINANSIHGPKGELRYYIATQAPLDNTVPDFWQMVWEQESKVIVMLTDFVEKGIDKCADYLPPSETLDCHRVYGDFQITLKSRDMRDKYIVSLLQIKNLENNLVREIAHMWYTGWPEKGVPNEERLFISFIFDVRTTRKQLRAKGPIIVHCSPGTGRTGTYIACDLCMRQFDEQKVVDIPKTVFRIRRERAGAIQTKEQYAFIYRVVNLYAAKLTTGNLDSF